MKRASLEDLGLFINRKLWRENRYNKNLSNGYGGANVCKCGKKISDMARTSVWEPRHFRGFTSHTQYCKLWKDEANLVLLRGFKEIVFNEKG